MTYRYPDSHVLYRSLVRDFPLAIRGEGCWLYDEEGRAYLDAVGGAFVASLGHGLKEIAEAIGAQAGQVAYVNGTQFTNAPAEALAAGLASRAPGDLDQVYFLSSGSEAVEAALKLARQYWVESGCPGKHKVLSLTPGYHGNTMLALAASGRPRYQTYFKEWLVTVPRVPAPYAYRCACHGEGSCPACTGDALEDAILAEGPETVAAFIGEPVGGSSTGATVPMLSYWARVREICDRHDVLWIADEVLCGAGRTGTWSALEPYGAVPDLLTMGKGITGGYVPLSAVVVPRRVADVIAGGSGALLHAQTFSHHPVLCAAGLATLQYLDEHHLVERCHRMGPVFHRKLDSLRDLPFVGDIRGRGLLAGVEFVQDKSSRAPFPRAVKFAERFTQAAQDAGLIVWPNTGQANGTDGDLAMLAPPFAVSDEELDQIVARFAAALERTPARP
jgi:adenosylmethionine-8-amino-7-oxononanoate aminotransferase